MIPPGPDLVRHNRRVFAERLNWPGGAVEACDEIDASNPGWQADWYHGPHGDGYYARHDNHWHLEPELFGRTPEDLDAAIRAHRCPKWQ